MIEIVYVVYKVLLNYAVRPERRLRAIAKGPQSKGGRRMSVDFGPFDSSASAGLRALRSGRTEQGVTQSINKSLQTVLGCMFLIFTLSVKGAIAMENTAKYENYLNGLKTLSGNFTQTNSRGQTAQGTIQISRPGRMRLTYAPPSSLVIVADGKWLVTQDRQADEVNYVSLENTPAAFILRPHVRFSGDVAITGVMPKEDGTTAVSLVRREDSDAGYITLVFHENPVSLKEWSVVDAQGIQTRVVLSNIQSNVQLPAGLFSIESPNLIQQIF